MLALESSVSSPIRSLVWSVSSIAVAMIATLAMSMTITPSTAQALTIDFESLKHGQVLDAPINGVAISAENFNRDFDLAVAFDSFSTGNSDEDLEAVPKGPDYWSGGNLVNEALGIMLIIQENDDACATGFCARPDDEGRRPAGELTFDFGKLPALDFGFDLVDIENLTAENGQLTFFDGRNSAVVQLMDFVDAGSDRYDASIAFGNNTANRFSAITAESLGLEKFDRVVLALGGSGAVDNVEYSVVPEPTTTLLFGLGLVGLALPGRRD